MKPGRTLLVLAFSCALCMSAPARAAPEPLRLSLSEAVTRARNNPLARAARAQQLAAEAQAAEARAARWPRLSLNAFVAPSPEIDCANADCTRTSPREVGPSVAGVFGGARLELAQPLFTFGKIDAAIAATAYAVGVQDALTDGVVQDVEFETVRAYFGLQLARELAAMLDEGLQQVQKAETTLGERLARGDPDVTVQDRLRLTTFTAEVQIRTSQAREKEAIALAGLRALVGEPRADTDDTPYDAVALDLPRLDAQLAQARSLRTELRAARSGAKALAERTRLEQARHWPDLLLTGAASVTRATAVDDAPSAFANDPFNADRAELALLLRWSLDVGQWARLDRARAEQQRGDDLLSAALANAEFKVHEAYEMARGAGDRLASARSGERSARGWVASVAQADALGVVSARDIADAYLAYFTLRSRTLESIYEWNLAVAGLARAAGTPLPDFVSRGTPEPRSMPNP